MQNQRDAMQDKDKQCERSKILKCKNARLSNTRCWLRTYPAQDATEAIQRRSFAIHTRSIHMQRNKIICFCTVLDAQPGILKSQKDRTQKERPGMKTSWNHEEQWTRTRRTWRTKKFVLDLIFWYFDTPFDHPLRLWLRTRVPVSVTVPWKFQAWRPQYVPLARSRKHSKVNHAMTQDALQRLISFWMDSKIATPNSGYSVFAVRAACSGGRFTSQQAMLENTGKGPSRKTELVETRTTCFCRPRQKKDQG